jgi:magnesium chelatase subunit I
VRLDKGILARADNNLLYIDEINLLDNEIINAILDAAAQGRYTVRRGPLSATYRARFVLIGSMNPEEGRLRPQILDRIGLHVIVRRLEDTQERLEVYRRVTQFAESPHAMVDSYAEHTLAMAEEIGEAKGLLPKVKLTPAAQHLTLEAIKRLEIASNRAEIFCLEAARAHAAADGRTAATDDDIRAVAPLVLRQRRSEFMIQYFEAADQQDKIIQQTLDEL